MMCWLVTDSVTEWRGAEGAVASACNYDSVHRWTTVCTITRFGCTDAEASNYDANATVDDGSCVFRPVVRLFGSGRWTDLDLGVL